MISIAIDGPAGAGKSSIAKSVASALGFIYVDTGALYRTIALYFIRNKVDVHNAAEVDKALGDIHIDIAFKDQTQQVILNGENVSELIRTPEVSMMASSSSALPPVRAFLLERQRELAEKHNVIMDGRDIGTVVLPNADLKIFLTASPEERARRRYDELIAKGEQVQFEDVLEDMKKRDYQDSHREIAPLKPAEDSITVDTSGKNLEQSVEFMLGLLHTKLPL